MPNNEEIKKLEAANKALQDANAALTSEKGKAEIGKAVAEAQRATVLAQLPPTEAKPLEGKVTVDAGVATAIQKLAYHAMSEVVEKMATAIRAKLPNLTTILIYSERDISQLAYHNAVTKQIARLRKGYQANQITKESPRPPGVAFELAMPILAPVVAGAAVKSVIDLLALFRTNVDIKGATVTFEEASLVAQVAKHLQSQPKRKNHSRSESDPQFSTDSAKAESPEVIYSALFVPGTLTPDPDDSAMLTSLGELASLRQKAQIQVAAFDAKDAAIKENASDAGRIAELKALNAAYDQLSTSIEKIDDKANLSALTLLLRAEALAKRIQGDRSAILFVKAVGGGENRTTQSLWRSGRLYHSGTAILTYLLFTDEKGLVLSDVISKTTDFEETRLVPS